MPHILKFDPHKKIEHENELDIIYDHHCDMTVKHRICIDSYINLYNASMSWYWAARKAARALWHLKELRKLDKNDQVFYEIKVLKFLKELEKSMDKWDGDDIKEELMQYKTFLPVSS